MSPYARPASVSLRNTLAGAEDLPGHLRGHETGLESPEGSGSGAYGRVVT